MVPPQDLGNAVALSVAAANVTRILGPAAAGVTLSLIGVEFVYILVAAMYVLTVGLQALLPGGVTPPGNAQTRGMLSEIGLAIRHIKGDETLRLLMIIALVPTILGMPFIILLAGFASEDLDLPDSGFATA